MKPLTEHTEYRVFLRQAFHQNKSLTPSLTLAQFANKLGMSISNLKMTLTGKRNLTIESIFRVGQVLNLSWTDQQFFEALVLANQAKDLNRKMYYEKKLAELAPGCAIESLAQNAPENLLLENIMTESEIVNTREN